MNLSGSLWFAIRIGKLRFTVIVMQRKISVFQSFFIDIAVRRFNLHALNTAFGMVHLCNFQSQFGCLAHPAFVFRIPNIIYNHRK